MSLHRIFKRCKLKYQDVIKLIFFPASSMTFLSETGFKNKTKQNCVVTKNILLVKSGDITPAVQFYLPLLLQQQCKLSTVNFLEEYGGLLGDCRSHFENPWFIECLISK